MFFFYSSDFYLFINISICIRSQGIYTYFYFCLARVYIYILNIGALVQGVRSKRLPRKKKTEKNILLLIHRKAFCPLKKKRAYRKYQISFKISLFSKVKVQMERMKWFLYFVCCRISDFIVFCLFIQFLILYVRFKNWFELFV